MQKMNLKKQLTTRHSFERDELARHIRSMWRYDRGKGDYESYLLDRKLEQAPFAKRLTEVLREKTALEGGKIFVLDKGAGHGNMLAQVKKFAPQKIVSVALTLSDTIAPENRPFIDQRIVGIGVRTKYRRRFDIIYDCYGEDNNLNITRGEFTRHSLFKSISYLKRKGVLFTTIRLLPAPSLFTLTIEEGRKLVEELSKMRAITVNAVEIPAKIAVKGETREWTDLVLEITRK